MFLAIPESRKRANNKWDKKNMTTLGCKIKRDQAAQFKAYCEEQGKTSNTVLKDFVLDCIDKSHTETPASISDGSAPAAAPGDSAKDSE